MEKLEANALLIDLDGTIADSSEVFEAAVGQALSAFGLASGSHRLGLEIVRGLQLDLSLDSLFEDHGIRKELRDKFLNVFLQAFYDLATRRTRLLPNMEHTLNELSQDFSLALITRRHVPKKRVAEELNRLQVDRFFQTIVTSLDVGEPTPSTDPLLKAADELQVAIGKCVVVSDSGVDIRAGKRAGAKTVAVLSGLFSEEELRKENPDLIIESIEVLPRYLIAVV